MDYALSPTLAAAGAQADPWSAGFKLGPYDATRMLRLLSGQTHQVITGICLAKAPGDIEALKHEVTFVTFVELSEDEIRGYIASQEPYDKAGGYAIQGLASRGVTRISGCYFNVVGLPISLLWDMLKNFPKPTAGGPNSSGV